MARRKDTNLARSTEWSETTCLIFCQPLWCLNVVVVGALMSNCRRFASSVETARKKMVAWNPGSEKLLAPSSSRSHFLSGHARRTKRKRVLTSQDVRVYPICLPDMRYWRSITESSLKRFCYIKVFNENFAGFLYTSS